MARGGSGGALALSRAPVGGSASPAPAPLPQPAPSPAPAALPPPALPPPPFRADTPHRPNGAHIPTIDGHAATQIPARPVGAAGPDTPERPASNNKLQPGARAAADSPTPAPPAPPAPSPLFPSHTAYQSHAAAAMPDYRHTNHETRTEPSEQPSAPLDLHAHHAPRPPAAAPPTTQPSHPSLPSRVPHSQPHPMMPGHDVRNTPTVASTHSSVPTSFPSRVNGVPPSVPPHATPPSNTSCLPNQTQPGRPVSPAAPTSRPYPTPSIGSSHINTSISSSIHSHPMPYQSQPSLQKHSVQSAFANRPPHLAPFSVANHLTSNHVQTSTTSQPTGAQLSHPINSHSIMNHTNHLSLNNSNSNPLTATSVPNHIGPPMSLSSTTSTISSYTTSLKHPGLSMPPHQGPLAPPVSLHAPMNHVESSPATSIAPSLVPPVSGSSSHTIAPPVVDSRQAVVSSSELAARTTSPAVSSTLASNGFPPPVVYSGATYPPLYAPYATTLQHSPYLPPAAASPRNSTDTVITLHHLLYC